MGVVIEGFCDPAFLKVKDIFETHLIDGKDTNSQLCIYVKNKCVVDLWGCNQPDSNFNGDSIQILFSSGKSVASFIIGVQVEKGLLAFDDKVSKHWPEFGQHGKQDLTIADILRHEGGLFRTCRTIGQNDALPKNIKENFVGKVFEDSSPHFPGSRRTYHSTTRGSILNEIVRRIDPRGRTMGEILREDIRIDGVCCGLTKGEMKRISRLDMLSVKSTIWQSLFGRRVYFGAKDISMMTSGFIKDAVTSKSSDSQPFIDLRGNPMEIIQSEEIRASEIFSFNVHASARGLARLASPLVNDGEAVEGDERLLSKETVDKMHDEVKEAFDTILGKPTHFTQGGFNLFEANPHPGFDRSGFHGWLGLGGSVFQWHRDLKISFAYVPSLLQFGEALHNYRGARLQQAAVECAKEYTAQTLNPDVT